MNKTGGRKKLVQLVPVRQVEGTGAQHLLKLLFLGLNPFITTDTGKG